MEQLILYVEDDEALSFVTKDNLEEKGYNIDHCVDGEQALAKFNENEYNICIIDVMLPKLDGFALAKKIREQNQHVPIIFLTAKSTLEDKLMGLKLGGDDYITKPFSIDELALKIEIFLKRQSITVIDTVSLSNIQIGIFTIDFAKFILKSPNKEIKMTFLEAELLKLFYTNQNKILKREDILIELWGSNDYFKGRSLDVFIARLRAYLSADKSLKIRNLHGVGFRFEC